jgi:hypothetical protein
MFNQLNARMSKPTYWDQRRRSPDCSAHTSLTTRRGGAMGTRTMEAADVAPPHGMERARRGRLRELLRVSGGAADPAASEQLGELEREVALLREENARLKLARQRTAERPVNERVRAAFPPPPPHGEDADGEDPWEVLTEGMLLRDALIDACRELEQGAQELRVRLETLLPAAEGEILRASENFEGVA